MTSIRGKWHVTTEGDCEGKTVTDLGIHEGYIDEIAFSLGQKCYYSLRFVPAKDCAPEPQISPVNAVNVSLDIGTGTWDMDSRQRVEFAQKLFRERPVKIEESPFYATFRLVADTQEGKP